MLQYILNELIGIGNLHSRFSVNPRLRPAQLQKPNSLNDFGRWVKIIKLLLTPHHSFGQLVINGTNTTVETIYSMLKAGESPEFVASIYELDPNAVKDVYK